jgi:hypothetical protein
MVLVSASERSDNATPPLQTWAPSSPCKPPGPTIPWPPLSPRLPQTRSSKPAHPPGAAPSSFLEANAIAAAALPVPADPIADPEAKVKTLTSAADQYNFIQERRAEWHAAGRPLK